MSEPLRKLSKPQEVLKAIEANQVQGRRLASLYRLVIRLERDRDEAGTEKDGGRDNA